MTDRNQSVADTFPKLLRERVRTGGDRPAMREKRYGIWQTWTWKDYEGVIRRFAHGLSGLALGVLTADCAPILLADPVAGVIGAAHAGWRGALAGIVEAAVAAMAALGARRGRIAAAIGPCIGRDSYEVGPAFPAPFLERTAENEAFFTPAPRPGHLLFDLGAYVRKDLAR
ncbi:MAG TPA: hypothetical protein EYO85_07255, partial [Rhodospirillales bacterium]|nr:hypothetical protein [Rhodospirillales bacterium]